MDKHITDIAGGMPFNQDDLAYFQQTVERLLNALGTVTAKGDDCILWGCAATDGAIAPGFINLGGALLYHSGTANSGITADMDIYWVAEHTDTHEVTKETGEPVNTWRLHRAKAYTYAVPGGLVLPHRELVHTLVLEQAVAQLHLQINGTATNASYARAELEERLNQRDAQLDAKIDGTQDYLENKHLNLAEDIISLRDTIDQNKADFADDLTGVRDEFAAIRNEIKALHAPRLKEMRYVVVENSDPQFDGDTGLGLQGGRYEGWIIASGGFYLKYDLVGLPDMSEYLKVQTISGVAVSISTYIIYVGTDLTPSQV